MGFRQRDVEQLLVRTGRRCCICKGLHAVSVHHIVPREESVDDDIENGIPLCPNCHDQVHGGGASGRITRQYTVSELKLHRQFTIDLVAQSVVPLGAQTATTGPTVTNLLKMVGNADIALTRCCVEGIEVAQAIGNESLELFCRDELSGYSRLGKRTIGGVEDSEQGNVKYRFVDSYLCLEGKVNPMAMGFMGATGLLERMQADTETFRHLRVVYPEPISVIEMQALQSDPAKLLVVNLSMSVFSADVPNDGTKPFGCYMAGDTPNKLLRDIRKEFINRLLPLV